MDLDINYQKALEMLKSELQKMKQEIDEVDEMPLTDEKQKMAQQMHSIYDQLEELTETYSRSHQPQDLNSVFRVMEALQPAFILNYDEICYESALEQLNEALTEMEGQLQTVKRCAIAHSEQEKLQEMEKGVEDLATQIEIYVHTHNHEDLEAALIELEQVRPSFVLFYNQLID
ncbi:MAG: hypothetical protein KDK60_04335 [Chlamydiia bacterium]|nr:hypothetical protein [Chlamydiia bacterium]